MITLAIGHVLLFLKKCKNNGGKPAGESDSKALLIALMLLVTLQREEAE